MWSAGRPRTVVVTVVPPLVKHRAAPGVAPMLRGGHRARQPNKRVFPSVRLRGYGAWLLVHPWVNETGGSWTRCLMRLGQCCAAPRRSGWAEPSACWLPGPGCPTATTLGGHRAVLVRDADGARLLSRSGREVTAVGSMSHRLGWRCGRARCWMASRDLCGASAPGCLRLRASVDETRAPPTVRGLQKEQGRVAVGAARIACANEADSAGRRRGRRFSGG
jgi:hypothetical protein